MKTPFFEFQCQRQQPVGLNKGFAAAERHPVDQRIGQNVGEDFVQRHKRAAVEGMGFRVVAPRAVMRTALREQHIAQPWAVYNGFADASGDTQCDFVQCLV